MADRESQRAGPTVKIGGQPVGLRLVGARLEDALHLAQGRVRVAFVQEGLGQDEPGGDVLGETLEAFATEADRIPDASSLAVGVGEGGEGQRGRIPCQALLITANGAEGGWIIGRQGPTDRRDRVSHPSLVIRGRPCRVNHSDSLRPLSAWSRGVRRGRFVAVVSTPRAAPHWLPALVFLLTLV